MGGRLWPTPKLALTKSMQNFRSMRCALAFRRRKAFGDDQAELGQQAANLVGLCCARFD